MSGRILVSFLALFLAGACATRSSASTSTVTVLAAASLKNVFPAIGKLFTRDHPATTVQFSFGGTDALAAQIEEGAPADVFAGASTKYGDQLAAGGLIDPWIPFCTNSLVLVLPAGNPAGVHSLADLARAGIKLVIGAESVPVGTYTRTALHNLDASLGPGYSTRVLANVVSNEESVDGVLTKVRLGEADAGFVYVTDARAAGSSVRMIALPPEAQARATYPIAVVRNARDHAAARAFVDLVVSPAGRAELVRAGFGPPPVPA